MHPSVAIRPVGVTVRLLDAPGNHLAAFGRGRRLASTPRIVAAARDLQEAAEPFQRIVVPLRFDPGVPHRDSLVKYAAAFFKISFS